MRLLDKELEKVISYKVGKFAGEELEESDIQKVEELSISNRSFSGKDKNVNLAELANFKNIRNLSLQYFKMDDSIIDLLNSLQGLTILQLASCVYDSEKQLDNKSLKTIIINSCDIKDFQNIKAPENFQLIGANSFKIGQLSGKTNVKRMFLQSCKVKKIKEIEYFDNLEKLVLEGSSVDDRSKLEELKNNVQVLEKDEYLPIK